MFMNTLYLNTCVTRSVVLGAKAIWHAVPVETNGYRSQYKAVLVGLLFLFWKKKKKVGLWDHLPICVSINPILTFAHSSL
jgi:hypothetical protein